MHKRLPDQGASARGAGSILRRRGQLPEKGTFSMTFIRIITKRASLTFPTLLLRLLLGGGGYLNMFEGRGTCQFLRLPFSKLKNECPLRNESMKYVQYWDFWKRTRKICLLILLCFENIICFAELWV